MHVSEALMITGGALIGWLMSRREDRLAPRRAPSPDYLQGVNFLVKDQPDRAVEAFLRAVKVERDMVETQFALGALFRRRGELERAIRVHQDLLKREALEPTFREQAAYALAQDYQRSGLMDRAEELLKQLTQSDHYRLAALEDLLSLYEIEREWQKAIDTFKCLAKESDPPNLKALAHYYCEWAEQMIVDGQFDEARQGIKQATKLHKQFSRAKFLQAKLELAEGHMDAAIEGLMELVVSEPRLSVELIPVLKNAFERSSKHSASPQQSEAAWSVVIHRASSSVSAADALAVALIVHGVLQFESVKTLIRAYVERDALLGGLLGAFKLSANQWDESTVAQVSQVVKRQAMKQSRYRCGECGFSSRLFFWQCPGCRQWDAWVSLSPTEA